MEKVYSSNEVIEALTEYTMAGRGARNRHVFRETLHALVRLAQCEKRIEMRRDVRKAIGMERRS